MAVGPEAPRKPQWRTDLEGLRVVAVLLVAIYHVWAGRVSGGVDVFLMLSGFFVGGSLWRRFTADDPPRAWNYVVRHLRRLWPAAVVVLAATAIGVVVVLPQTRWTDAAHETLASLFFYENWQLVSSGMEYGAADPNQSAWQHFWSISVQAQLFVIVPIVLFVVWHFMRRNTARARTIGLAVTLGLLTAGSFALAVWQMSVDPAVGYLSTATRAWEFLVGALLAALLSVWTPKTAIWAALSWVAFGALLVTGLFIDGGQAFPGVLALVPIGTAAVIVLAGAAPQRWGASVVLAPRFVSSLGKYAYGFYLWHWPVLILSSAVRGSTPGWAFGSAILAASAVLAVATYHLVEKPLREGSFVTRPAIVWRRIATPVVALTMLGVVAAPIAWTQHVEAQKVAAAEADDDLYDYPGVLAITDPVTYGDFEEKDPIPSLDIVKWDTSKIVSEGCVATGGVTDPVDCTYPYGHVERVALFGASHSEQLFEIAEVLAEKRGWTLVPIIKPSCPPALPEDADSEECMLWASSALTALEDGGFDLIITTSTRPGEVGDYTPDSYLRLFDVLEQIAPVLGVRDNPWFPVDMAECVAGTDPCEFELYSLLSPDFPDEALRDTGVIAVDTNDLVCPEDLCRPVIANRIVFRDDNHLTTTYVQSIKSLVAERWEEALESAGVLER